MVNSQTLLIALAMNLIVLLEWMALSLGHDGQILLLGFAMLYLLARHSKAIEASLLKFLK